MKKRTKTTIAITALLAATITAAVMLPACNTLDSPYEDAARAAAAEAGAPSPKIVDAQPSAKPLLAECVSFYVESEASDFFLRELGDPRGKDEVDCGDDSLYYLDQTWNCNVFGVNYTVVRYSRDDEAAREVRRTVIADDKSPSWSFQCKYNSECTQIRCKVL